MVGAVAAQVAERDMPWQHQQQPHEMAEKLPWWSRKIRDGRQYTLEESHELSSWTGKLGNLTLEDDGSCGHLSLKKMSEVLVL
jgi:hypothetical protein